MIYLDNGATTPICAEAVSACVSSFENYGNPSSVHSLGLYAKKAMRASAAKIERILGAEEGTFYFTSGATESNNWAIFGAGGFNPKRGNHIITSKTEHPSITEPLYEMARQGFRVTFINVDRSGHLDLEELFASIGEDTVLVSIMAANNETGVINDIQVIGSKIKQINENTVFHVDGVCAFCKMPINVNNSKIDLFSLSGHKIHAPKGIGGLYIRPGTRIKPFIYGGGQQRGMRSGTENTVYAEALAVSAEVCSNDMKENSKRVQMLKEKLKSGVLELETEINGANDKEKSSPYVLNVGFRWIKSQIMINALEERGVYAAAGSACSSGRIGRKAQSSTLLAMGIGKELIEGAVRFTFSRFNTEAEIDTCIDVLRDIYRKYRGKI